MKAVSQIAFFHSFSLDNHRLHSLIDNQPLHLFLFLNLHWVFRNWSLTSSKSKKKKKGSLTPYIFFFFIKLFFFNDSTRGQHYGNIFVTKYWMLPISTNICKVIRIISIALQKQMRKIIGFDKHLK